MHFRQDGGSGLTSHNYSVQVRNKTWEPLSTAGALRRTREQESTSVPGQRVGGAGESHTQCTPETTKREECLQDLPCLFRKENKILQAFH